MNKCLESFRQFISLKISLDPNPKKYHYRSGFRASADPPHETGLIFDVADGSADRMPAEAVSGREAEEGQRLGNRGGRIQPGGHVSFGGQQAGDPCVQPAQN